MEFNFENTNLLEEEIFKYDNDVKNIISNFEDKIYDEKTNNENNFLGWMNLPNETDESEIDRIKEAAKKIRQTSEVLVVLGIGGSLMSAKSIVSALQKKNDHLEIIFLGNSLSEMDIKDNLEYLRYKKISLNVISKSGKTLETSIAFRIFKDFMREKYGEKFIERIYITTDKEKGALRTFADKNNLETFIIPDNIGGRYSAFTPVGLLPVAAAGIDIDKILIGIKKASEDFSDKNIKNNPALQYAVIRYLLYKKGFKIELFVNYEPRLECLNKWLVQLFGESEGKDEKGIFPSSAVFSSDLHSIGQFIQDGTKILFETVMFFNNTRDDKITISEDEDNLDQLNYLKGKSISEINKSAMIGTMKAHVDGEVPNILIEMGNLNEKNLAYLMQFFMLACSISAELLGVNPFNQPGVEKYKSNIYKILGKK